MKCVVPSPGGQDTIQRSDRLTFHTHLINYSIAKIGRVARVP